ncbi:hypothetical protein [Aquirufa aurantiipilula]|uniref:Lipoprotein n=1 Tax=Aquirufa aurantiipilula TaxID=2696561 RepID=A0ABT6BKQ1_9BACT|nr:hypothetical protein [Aquirufa aurantiipilula]MDF5691055.1 hypothetical protein [Aquirufa aurantiipilula]
MKNYLYSIVLLAVLSCQSSKSENQETLVPNLILNDVLACKDLAGLQAQYGKESLVADTSWILNEDTLRGSILYPNTNKQVYIMYHQGQILDVSVLGKQSLWKTNSGLYLGLKVLDVEKLNQKNFTISGFNWVNGGMVVSWEGGKLGGDNLTHVVQFSNSENQHEGLSDMEYSQISGEAEFDIRHPLIQKLNPSLDQLAIVKPYVPSKSEGQSMGKHITKTQVPTVKKKP